MFAKGTGRIYRHCPRSYVLRISLLADRFEGGCFLMVLMRAYNRWHYCLGHSIESKMDVRICIGLVN